MSREGSKSFGDWNQYLEIRHGPFHEFSLPRENAKSSESKLSPLDALFLGNSDILWAVVFIRPTS